MGGTITRPEKEEDEAKWLRFHVVTYETERYLFFKLGEPYFDQPEFLMNAQDIIVILTSGRERLKEIEIDIGTGINGVETFSGFYEDFNIMMMHHMLDFFEKEYKVFPKEFSNLRVTANIGQEERDAVYSGLSLLMESLGYYNTSIPDVKHRFDERKSFLKEMILKRAGTKVLITGGMSYDQDSKAMRQTQIYDMDGRNIMEGPPMVISRKSHASTTLLDGRIFICGGVNENDELLRSCEVFDPIKMEFTLVSEMNHARSLHSAVTLPDGRVLIVGSSAVEDQHAIPEIYDPNSGDFVDVDRIMSHDVYVGDINLNLSPLNPLERIKPTVNLLSNGEIFIAGGVVAHVGMAEDTAIYNIAEEKLNASYSYFVRYANTATTLLDDSIFLCGGVKNINPRIYNLECEIYNPFTKTFRKTRGFSNSKIDHTASLLIDGNVFIFGGTLSESFTLLRDSEKEDYYKLDYIPSNLECHAASSFF